MNHEGAIGVLGKLVSRLFYPCTCLAWSYGREPDGAARGTRGHLSEWQAVVEGVRRPGSIWQRNEQSGSVVISWLLWLSVFLPGLLPLLAESLQTALDRGAQGG